MQAGAHFHHQRPLAIVPHRRDGESLVSSLRGRHYPGRKVLLERETAVLLQQDGFAAALGRQDDVLERHAFVVGAKRHLDGAVRRPRLRERKDHLIVGVGHDESFPVDGVPLSGRSRSRHGGNAKVLAKRGLVPEGEGEGRRPKDGPAVVGERVAAVAAGALQHAGNEDRLPVGASQLDRLFLAWSHAAEEEHTDEHGGARDWAHRLLLLAAIGGLILQPGEPSPALNQPVPDGAAPRCWRASDDRVAARGAGRETRVTSRSGEAAARCSWRTRSRWPPPWRGRDTGRGVRSPPDRHQRVPRGS